MPPIMIAATVTTDCSMSATVFQLSRRSLAAAKFNIISPRGALLRRRRGGVGGAALFALLSALVAFLSALVALLIRRWILMNALVPGSLSETRGVNRREDEQRKHTQVHDNFFHKLSPCELFWLAAGNYRILVRIVSAGKNQIAVYQNGTRKLLTFRNLRYSLVYSEARL